MIRLLVIDDQVIFREGLVALLAMEVGIEIIGEGGNGHEAIALAEELQPDVILMDVRMPICDGVTATKEIHQRFPGIRIMVLTTFDEDEFITKSLQNGALGYILKSTPSKQLAIIIRSLAQGFGQLDPAIAFKVFAQIDRSAAIPSSETLQLLENLNQRETHILRSIGKGKTNREIALELYLTEGTIKNYISNILRCLELRERTQIALWVMRNIKE